MPVDAAGRGGEDRALPRTLAGAEGADALRTQGSGQVHRGRHPLQEHGSAVPRRAASTSRSRKPSPRRRQNATNSCSSTASATWMPPSRWLRRSTGHVASSRRPWTCPESAVHRRTPWNRNVLPFRCRCRRSASALAAQLALDSGRSAGCTAADLARVPLARAVHASDFSASQRDAGGWASVADGQSGRTLHADALRGPRMPVLPVLFPSAQALGGRQCGRGLQWHHLPLAAHEPAASARAWRNARAKPAVMPPSGRPSSGYMPTRAATVRLARGPALPRPYATHRAVHRERAARRGDSRPNCGSHEQRRDRHAVAAATRSRNRQGYPAAGSDRGRCLLSAMDMLAARDPAATPSEMPADVVGDMPR